MKPQAVQGDSKPEALPIPEHSHADQVPMLPAVGNCDERALGEVTKLGKSPSVVTVMLPL